MSPRRLPPRGLAPQQPAEPPPRPPGPPTILGPDGRTWTRAEDGLYYDEHRREVFSQAALRDLIERAQERLERACAGGCVDSVMLAIMNAKTVEQLRAVFDAYVTAWTEQHTIAARGRRAVLELSPKEDHDPSASG